MSLLGNMMKRNMFDEESEDLEQWLSKTNETKETSATMTSFELLRLESETASGANSHYATWLSTRCHQKRRKLCLASGQEEDQLFQMWLSPRQSLAISAKSQDKRPILRVSSGKMLEQDSGDDVDQLRNVWLSATKEDRQLMEGLEDLSLADEEEEEEDGHCGGSYFQWLKDYSAAAPKVDREDDRLGAADQQWLSRVPDHPAIRDANTVVPSSRSSGDWSPWLHPSDSVVSKLDQRWSRSTTPMTTATTSDSSSDLESMLRSAAQEDYLLGGVNHHQEERLLLPQEQEPSAPSSDWLLLSPSSPSSTNRRATSFASYDDGSSIVVLDEEGEDEEDLENMDDIDDGEEDDDDLSPWLLVGY